MVEQSEYSMVVGKAVETVYSMGMLKEMLMVELMAVDLALVQGKYSVVSKDWPSVVWKVAVMVLQ